MKILHIIPRMIGGGPERSLLAMARELGALGHHQNDVIAVLDTPVARNMFLAARRLNIKLVVRPDQTALERLIADADLVQIQFWNHPALLAVLRGVTFPPARVVVTAHVLGLTAPQLLTEEIGRFADALVLTSAASRQSAAVRAAHAVGREVVVIPSIADFKRLEGFKPRSHDGCVVGYLGSVSDAKMHPHFAQLAARATHPSVRFLIYGGGGKEEVLRRELARLGLEGRAEVAGPIENIREAFEGMDIFGYPLAEYTYATSELVLQEAMWVGLPPVVFPHGGVRLLVEHERTGLVAQTEAQYGAAIDRLAADAELRSRLGSQAERFARTHFEPRRAAEAMAALMTRLVATPRRIRSVLGGGSGAAGFVATLGDHGGPFAVSLTGAADEDAAFDRIETADTVIAASHAALARGEGGVVHYRNANPDDPHLRLWSGLLAEATGNLAQARSEFEAAEALGLGDSRPARYVARCRSH